MNSVKLPKEGGGGGGGVCGSGDEGDKFRALIVYPSVVVVGCSFQSV